MTYQKIEGVYIYQSISNPTRIYVGSSHNLQARKILHNCLLRKNKHHSPQLQNHYNKYGQDDLVFEVIESGTYLDKNHLLAREQGWFDHFSFNGEKLPFFNNQFTAGSNKGVKFTKEHCLKISKGTTGIKKTTDPTHVRERCTYVGNRKPRTQQQKDNQSLKMKGKPCWCTGTKGVVVAWNKGMSGEYHTSRLGVKTGKVPKSAFKKGQIPWNKDNHEYSKGVGQLAVYQYDLNGNFIKEWISKTEAANSLNISVFSISRMCRGYIYKRAYYEFIFKYKKDVVI